MKVLTPREAGYAMQLSGKTMLDVRPSSEREKVVHRATDYIFYIYKPLRVNLILLLENGNSMHAFAFLILPLTYLLQTSFCPNRHRLRDQFGFQFLMLMIELTSALLPERYQIM